MKITALILAFYMLIGGLIPRTDFSQLVHLADLKAHYLEHKAEAASNNVSFSLLDFLYIHFIDMDEHENLDHEEDHQQLPFQSLNAAVIFVLPDLLLPNFITERQIFQRNINFYNPFYLRGFTSSTIQPPSPLLI